MMIIGLLDNKELTPETIKEQSRETWDRIGKLAKKNRISEEYCGKLMELETRKLREFNERK